jgi:hypothetical protein
MKPFFLLICLFTVTRLPAQEKKPAAKKEVVANDLPDIKKMIAYVQENAALYVQNAKDHSKEVDVNSIILDIEKYIDSTHKVRTYSDQLLIKYFNPLRHFFLTTTNKTTVATMFLYPSTPYHFCTYGDTAVVLYVAAVKDGNTYNLNKMTENTAAKATLKNCLLPALKAMDEFTGTEPKYIAISDYYGTRDIREGGKNTLEANCLTLVARATELQQYAAGLITEKGLLANAELYLGSDDLPGELHRIHIAQE